MWTLWLGSSVSTSSSTVTFAVPATTTQCSARCLWLCRLSRPPGVTTISLTLKAGPSCSTWKLPQGRCSVPWADGLRPPGGLEHADQLAHRVAAVAVGDQHRVVGLDHREIAHARAGDEAALGMDQAVLAGVEQRRRPCTALPAASFGSCSQSACQEPRSDQPGSHGTTAIRRARSITALSIGSAGTAW